MNPAGKWRVLALVARLSAVGVAALLAVSARAEMPVPELPPPWQHVVIARWEHLEVRAVFKPTAALVDPEWIGLEFRNDSGRSIDIHQLLAFARLEVSDLSRPGRTWSSREWLGNIGDQLPGGQSSYAGFVPPGITQVLVSPSEELGAYLGDPDRWPSNGYLAAASDGGERGTLCVDASIEFSMSGDFDQQQGEHGVAMPFQFDWRSPDAEGFARLTRELIDRLDAGCDSNGDGEQSRRHVARVTALLGNAEILAAIPTSAVLPSLERDAVKLCPLDRAIATAIMRNFDRYRPDDATLRTFIRDQLRRRNSIVAGHLWMTPNLWSEEFRAPLEAMREGGYVGRFPGGGWEPPKRTSERWRLLPGATRAHPLRRLTTEPATELSRLANAEGLSEDAIVACGDVLAFISKEGALVATGRSSGRERWALVPTREDRLQHLTTSRARLVAVSRGGAVVAVQAADGRRAWDALIPDAWSDNRVAADNDVVIVTGSRMEERGRLRGLSLSLIPKLTALDARGGRTLWTREIVGDLAIPPRIENGLTWLLVGYLTKYRVLAFDSATGAKVADYRPRQETGISYDPTGPIPFMIPALKPPPGLKPPWESDAIPPY